MRDNHHAEDSTEELDTKIRTIAVKVRDALSPVLESVAGVNPRPVRLTRELGIDKTLAGRLLRSLRSNDALQALHLSPAPHGLRIFVEAARRHGASDDQCHKAESFIREFEDLIDEFPGGRSALDAALSSWLPEVREQEEKRAKQAVFKAMSSILGYQADAMYLGKIIRPNDDDPDFCDVATIHTRFEIRRLRAGASITLLGYKHESQDEAAVGPQPIPGPNGEAVDTSDPHSYLLEDYCGDALPELQVHESNNRMVVALEGGEPGVNVPLDVAAAYVSRKEFVRYRNPDSVNEWLTILPKIPCRLLVMDVLIHKDVYPNYTPNASTRLEGLSSDWLKMRKGPNRLDELDLSVETSRLEIGTSRLSTADIPGVVSMNNAVCSRLGWDTEDFRAFRLRVLYPVPSVSITTWFDLPER